MAMTKCSECGKEISSKAKACPSCGVEVKQKVTFLKAVGVILAGIIVVTIMVNRDRPSSTDSSVASAVAAVTPASSLTATDIKFKRGQYDSQMFTGKIVNTTGKKLSYVQVEINLYDKQDVQVGSTLANVNNLEPGVTWAFEAPVIEDRAKSGKVAGITAY